MACKHGQADKCECRVFCNRDGSIQLREFFAIKKDAEYSILIAGDGILKGGIGLCRFAVIVDAEGDLSDVSHIIDCFIRKRIWIAVTVKQVVVDLNAAMDALADQFSERFGGALDMKRLIGDLIPP